MTLPEILVALLLGLCLVQLGLETLARLDSARRRMAARTDYLVALRVSRHVLRTELELGGPTDWESADDSVGLRAFRGTAVVCQADSVSATVRVSFRGERAPDPSKDSVVLVTELGGREVRALTAVGAATAPCLVTDSAEAASWSLNAPAPGGTVLARLFERGAYHLSGSALRYRRGASGRQPLTPEVLSPGTGWIRAEDRVGVELIPSDPAAGAGWSGVVAWSERP